MPSHPDRVRQQYIDSEKPDRADATSPELQDWLRLIRAEYEEVPALHLTLSQVEERWGLEAPVAETVLKALVSDGVLERTPRGTFILNNAR